MQIHLVMGYSSFSLQVENEGLAKARKSTTHDLVKVVICKFVKDVVKSELGIQPSKIPARDMIWPQAINFVACVCFRQIGNRSDTRIYLPP